MQSPKFQQFAHCYDNATPIQSDVALFLANLIADHHDLNKKNQQILDIGCGTGKLSLAILQTLIHYNNIQQLYGVDNSDNMLKIWLNHCQNLYKNSNITFQPILTDMANLPFENNYFDMVVSSFSVHWTSPNTLIEFCRVTKKGGQLHLSIPVFGSFQQVIERFPLLPIYDFLPADDWLAVIQNLTKQKSGKILYQIEQDFTHCYDNLALLLKELKKMGGTVQFDQYLSTQQWREYLADRTPIVLNYQMLLIGIKI